MVRTFLKVYMELCSYFLFLQEQIKNIIIIKEKPPKRVCDPRMRDQIAVNARGRAAPTGVAPAGTFSTPVREEPWRTRPQFPVHGGCPSPATGDAGRGFAAGVCVCVCVLLLQDLLQRCERGGRRRVEDMCYERRRAETCVDESAHHALGPVRNPVL